MKKFYRILITTLVLLICFSNTVFAENDRITESGRIIPIPETYTVSKVLLNLGETGNLNHPEDLFLDSKGILYVADTGNNRVLRMSREGEVLEIIKGPKDKPFSKPNGVFVDEDGILYVADTGNKRVVRLLPNGQYDKEYLKPESNLLGADFSFDPSKIALSSTGYMYVLKSSSFMMIDDQNRFRGYVGAKEIGFDFRRMLMRLFATRSQRDRIAKVLPVSYSNFVIGHDGLIYATILNTDKGQIRKLNSVGKNLYPELEFGETGMGPTGTPVTPSFTDIAVDKNGIITVIDKNNKSVYQYDQEGNLLLAFGGQGERKGTFQIPSSIVVDENGKIYIADSQSGNIQIFEPTNFTKTIHTAVSLYNNGDYQKARAYWQEVLNIDANYSLAHKGMAKLYLKEGNWEQAMDEYKMAEDKDGYSKAFKEYRHTIFRTNFVIVFFCAIAIAASVYFALLWFIAKANKVADELTMGKGGY